MASSGDSESNGLTAWGATTITVVRGYPCTNCKKGTPASHYCPKCDVFFCKSCLLDLCDHGALGLMSIAKWGQPTPLLEEDCHIHPGNLVQIYCPHHDAVGCCVCFQSGKHKPCDEAKYIPEVADVMNQSSNILKMKRDLKKIGKMIKGLKSNQQQKQATLRKSHNKTNTMIKTYRKKINGILDKLEKQSEEEVRNYQQSANAKLQANLEMLDSLEKEVDQFQEKIEKIGRNTTQVFTRVKRCEEWLSDADKTLIDIGATQGYDKIDYKLDNKIEKMLADFEAFGKIYSPETVYTVKKMKDYPIKIDKDENKCNITSICQVTDDKFVITDNDNNRLKLLDASFNVISDCDLTNWPWSVCTVGDKEVAVTLGGNQVQFVTVGNGLVPGKSYRLNHSCFGVAYSIGRLYIADQCKSLFMYIISDSRLQLDSMVRICTNLLNQSRNLTVKADGTALFVADFDKGLVTIGEDGKLIATLKPREIMSAFGVCVAPNGYVFMAGQDSDNVVQVDRKGERKLKELVAQSKGLTKPQGVCVDRTTYRLLVVGGCNQLRVFDLAQEG